MACEKLLRIRGIVDIKPVLCQRAQGGCSLSGCEQQMLAIAHALMSNPRVLLMDEPSEGLAPQIVAEVMATIQRLKEQGLSIVLVEQNAKLVFDVADDIAILNSGRGSVQGTAADLLRSGIDLREHPGIADRGSSPGRTDQRAAASGCRCRTRVESRAPDTSTTRKAGGPGRAFPACEVFESCTQVDGVVSTVSPPRWMA